MLIAAVPAGDVNDFLGVAAALTGLGVGGARYWVTLRGGSRRTIERATAVGFFAGFGASAIAVIYLVIG